MKKILSFFLIVSVGVAQAQEEEIKKSSLSGRIYRTA